MTQHDARPRSSPAPAPGGPDEGRPEASLEPRLVLRVLGSSRFFVIFAVLGSFLAASTLVVYGALVAATVAWNTFTDGDISIAGAKHLTVELVQLTDSFILGTVLFIVAFGLYQLFVNPNLPVPNWLRVSDLDQLKEKLIGVVAVFLAVTFLAFVVEVDIDASVLEFGAAVALVIASLSLFLFVIERRGRDASGQPRDE